MQSSRFMSRFSRRSSSGNRRRPKRRFESLEVRAMLSGDGGAGGATPLLPDLIPVASESEGYMYDWLIEDVVGDRRLLRLSTATANIGQGPLELRGSVTNPDGTQDVLQRVYQGDGSHEDHLAGEFIYHPQHDHIHFEGFAEYNLRAVTEGNGVGDVVASGGKTSFCVIDLDDYDLGLPGAPNFPEYDACGSRQGLSVGWEDIYDRDLPDQWIDVTDVPINTYWLEVVSDPDNHILESDDTNNVVRILVELYVPEPLEADAYEPNNTALAAADLGMRSTLIEDLSIHASGDDDWFAWTSTESGGVTITTRFIHSLGDVDLFVYDAARRLLDSSEGVENEERITLRVGASQRLLIKVIGFGGDVNRSYSLSIDAGDELILPDHFEPNNSLESPAHLDPGTQTWRDLTIHTPTDHDYFRWTAPGAGRLRVRTEISGAAGELELRFYNMLREEIAVSADGGDFEELSLDQVPAGALMYFGVVGADGHAVPAYDLLIEFVPRLAGDANGDGVVDLDDLNLVRNHFGETGDPQPGDTDFDGDVDLNDLNAVRNHFGTSIGGSPATPMIVTTPESKRSKFVTDVDVLARLALAPRPRSSTFFVHKVQLPDWRLITSGRFQ